jgi:hypothetical protein
MKKLVPLLMIALAAATIAAVYAWQELRDVRSQASALKARIPELQLAKPAPDTTPTLPASAAIAVQTDASMAPTGVAPAAGAAAAAAAPTPAATQAGKKVDPLQNLAQQMLGTPEGQEMLRAQLRAMLPQQFPDIGKELGLTPAETEKLLDMLVKHQLSVTGDALNMLGGNGSQDAAAMQETRRKLQEQQRSNQAELATLLGDKMPRYEAYQRTLPLRQQVSQLKTALGTGNNALSDTQGQQLIAALAAEQALIQQERRNTPGQQQQGPRDPQAAMDQQLARAAEDNRRMVSAARSHLNAQQLESYRRMLEQQQELQRTLMRSIGAQGSASSQPAPGPRAP